MYVIRHSVGQHLDGMQVLLTFKGIIPTSV